jgi:hypothetical protein
MDLTDLAYKVGRLEGEQDAYKSIANHIMQMAAAVMPSIATSFSGDRMASAVRDVGSGLDEKMRTLTEKLVEEQRTETAELKRRIADLERSARSAKVSN